MIAHCPRQPVPRPAAFTLLEMLTAVIVLILVGGVALSAFSNAIFTRRADAAAERLILDLTQARRHAQRAGVPVAVLLDPSDDHYEITELPNPDHTSALYTVRLGAAPYEAELVSVTLVPAAALTADPARTIEFDHHGRADHSATIVLRAGDRSVTVEVDADSGEARRP